MTHSSLDGDCPMGRAPIVPNLPDSRQPPAAWGFSPGRVRSLRRRPCGGASSAPRRRSPRTRGPSPCTGPSWGTPRSFGLFLRSSASRIFALRSSLARSRTPAWLLLADGGVGASFPSLPPTSTPVDPGIRRSAGRPWNRPALRCVQPAMNVLLALRHRAGPPRHPGSPAATDAGSTAQDSSASRRPRRPRRSPRGPLRRRPRRQLCPTYPHGGLRLHADRVSCYCPSTGDPVPDRGRATARSPTPSTWATDRRGHTRRVSRSSVEWQRKTLARTVIDVANDTEAASVEVDLAGRAGLPDAACTSTRRGIAVDEEVAYRRDPGRPTSGV